MVGNMSASSSFTLTVLALHHSLIALPSAAARNEHGHSAHRRDRPRLRRRTAVAAASAGHGHGAAADARRWREAPARPRAPSDTRMEERDGRTTLAATRERRAEPDVTPEAGRRRRRTADCVSRGWHTTPGGSGCANDDDFPAAWLAPAVAAHMFLATSEQCCSKFYPNTACQVRDSGCRMEGEEEEETAGGCVSRGWHIVPGMDGCYNDDNFPQEWLDPAISRYTFTETAEQCCSKFYPGKEQECDIHLSGCRPEGGGAAAPAAVDSASYPIALKDEVEEEEKDAKGKQQEKEDQQEEEQQLEEEQEEEQELEEEEEEQELEEEKALKCMWHPAGSSESCAYTASYPAVWTNPEWSDMYLYESLATCCFGVFGLEDCEGSVTCDEPPEEEAAEVRRPSAATRATSAPVPRETVETFAIVSVSCASPCHSLATVSASTENGCATSVLATRLGSHTCLWLCPVMIEMNNIFG